MSQFTVDQALQIAIQYQQNGQLLEAEDIYRQILKAYPDQPDALHLLGVTAHQGSRNELAEELIRKALALAPNTTTFRLSLGSVLQAQQRTADAIALYQETLTLDPNSADACSNLGVALTTAGRYLEAINAFERALQLSPGHTAANGNMGIALFHLGRYEEALRALRSAIAYQPRVPAFHASLAATLLKMEQTEAALAACQQAIAIDPTHGRAHQVLSMALAKLNRPTEALEASRLAAENMPELLDAQLSYGAALIASGKLDESIDFHRRAIEKNPRSGALHNNLANTLKDQGLLAEALAEFQRAMELEPAAVQFHSNYVYSLYFQPNRSMTEIFEEHRKFNEKHALPLQPQILPYANDPTMPGAADPYGQPRRLRIGYVSNEFRGHVIGLNLLPLLTNHDKSRFEIFCYSDVATPDFYTYRFQQSADHFSHTLDKTAPQLAESIRRDRIDILVDLNQHLSGERLLLFARKPAPVQVSFAAYPATTGLTAIDYRLTDPHLEPVDAQFPSSEAPVRLPHSFWCYQPPVSDVAVNSLPARDMGYITFGNLNNFAKLNEKTFELWALVMRGVTRSRLIMLAPEGSHRTRTIEFFGKHGISPDRIDFVPRMPPEKYVKVYHRLDLGLDSFPYNGHNTSLDSLYMGVPVVTMIGETPVGRGGLSQLTNLGLEELVAKSPSEFIRIATELANDWNRLEKLRAELRPRMQSSPLMNQKQFAADIEAAYLEMWQKYCTTAPRTVPTANPFSYKGTFTPFPPPASKS